MYCVGVDVGGTTVKMGLFTVEGKVVDKWEIVTRREEAGKYILDDICRSIQSKWNEKSVKKEEIVGVGLGIAGPITEDGTVLKCANLGWGVFNVADEVRKRLGIERIKVANDANVAALGEMWQGGGKGCHNIVMMTLGTGVGGGIVINGKIVTGSKGAAGEIGHITVNYNETDSCGCGKKGCLEQYASATGIVKEAKRKLKEIDTPSSIRNIEHLSAKVIFDHAKNGDKLCLELVEQLGWYLGMATSHIATVVDPEAFVIGGGVSRAGEVLTNVVKKYYEQNVIFALQNKEFRLAKLGNDAGIYGSAKMVLD